MARASQGPHLQATPLVEPSHPGRTGARDSEPYPISSRTGPSRPRFSVPRCCASTSPALPCLPLPVGEEDDGLDADELAERPDRREVAVGCVVEEDETVHRPHLGGRVEQGRQRPGTAPPELSLAVMALQGEGCLPSYEGNARPYRCNRPGVHRVRGHGGGAHTGSWITRASSSPPDRSGWGGIKASQVRESRAACTLAGSPRRRPAPVATPATRPDLAVDGQQRHDRPDDDVAEDAPPRLPEEPRPHRPGPHHPAQRAEVLHGGLRGCGAAGQGSHVGGGILGSKDPRSRSLALDEKSWSAVVPSSWQRSSM